MTTKRASAFLRKDTIILQAQSQTPDGIWIFDGEVVAHPLDAPGHEVGAAMLQALGRSRHGVIDPDPQSSTALLGPLLKVASVRSWKTFMNGAKLVHVEQSNEDSVKLMPTANNGTRGGFTELSDDALVILAPSEETLGHALKQAFEACT